MKRKIAFYCVANHLGGAERSLLDLLAQLRADPAFELTVILPRARGPLGEAVDVLGISRRLIVMPAMLLRLSRGAPFRSLFLFLAGIPGLLSYLYRVRAELRQLRPNLVHTTGLKCHILALLATTGMRDCRIVWHLRDIFTSSPPRLLLLAAHRLARSKPTIVANSAATAASFSRRIPCAVVHNGVATARAEAPRSAGIRPVVGIVGVLARWKGQLEFLAMAHELGQRGLDAEYWVVGDQIYDTIGDRGFRGELEERAEELGLANVRFLGYRADMSTVYRELDILVHASLRPEPFGRVLIEAQAQGVCVAASGAGGVLEIVKEGDNGLLFLPGNIEKMADQVEKLVRNEGGLRERLSKNARRQVLERFTLEAHGEKMKRVFEGELQA